MALTQSILKLKVTEDRDAVVPSFSFQDTTDYTGNSVTIANVKAAIKIDVDGVNVYDNLANISTTPDIDGSSSGQTNEDLLRSRTKAVAVPLPTIAGSNAIKQGSIKVTYRVTDGVDTVTNVITIDNTCDKPTGELETSLDLTPTSPLITVEDTTTYVVNQVTPTKTRTLSLFYPSSTGETASTTTSTELTTQRFYSGQQQATLSIVCNWNYSTNTATGTTSDWTSGNFTYIINDTVTASEFINVSSDTSICEVFCCVKEFDDKLSTAKGDAKQRLLQTRAQIGTLLSFVSASFSCSSTSKVNQWVDEIKDLAGCNGDCSCNDGQPVLITPVTSTGLQTGQSFEFTTKIAQTTVQNAAIVNKVYNSTQKDFIVFLDGIKDNGSHVSSTGTYTFQNAQPAGVEGEVIILN